MTAGRTINSENFNWCTPVKYVDAVKEVFGGAIDLDPCSNEWSIVGATTQFILPEHDGLAEQWDYKRIYVNPPYGSDRKRKTTIKHWLCKCADAFGQFDSEVLALVPVAVNTSHWKEFVWGKATAVCFLYDTRLKFLEKGNEKCKGAPMACAMVYWGNNYARFFDVFLEFGAVVDLQGLLHKRIGSGLPQRPLFINVE